MRFLSVAEVVELHRRVLLQTGGAQGIRDHGALESAIAQPLQTHGGQDLYVTVVEKAAALGFFLCRNHPFVDGNKRVAHVALEVTLILNEYELSANTDEQEAVMLKLASGAISREEFTRWVEKCVWRTGARHQE